jgi:hypothetical protein
MNLRQRSRNSNPKLETATFVFLMRKVLVAIHDQCEAKREAAE